MSSMFVRLIGLVFGISAISSTADAQLFWKSPAFEGGYAQGNEAGLLIALPGATPAEQDANLTWTTRAALNVAALQCQFSPALMVTQTYNAVLCGSA